VGSSLLCGQKKGIKVPGRVKPGQPADVNLGPGSCKENTLHQGKETGVLNKELSQGITSGPEKGEKINVGGGGGWGGGW